MSKCRRVVLVVTTLAVVAAGLLWAARERFQNRLTVENRSGQGIAVLRVTTGGQTIAFRDVPAGGRVSARFTIRSDDHFALEARLADGTPVEGDFGYVTNGMAGERVRFSIRPGGKVDFDQSNNIPAYRGGH